MNWVRWQCRNCSYTFVLKKGRVPNLECKKCNHSDWFDKIKELENKYDP